MTHGQSMEHRYAVFTSPLSSYSNVAVFYQRLFTAWLTTSFQKDESDKHIKHSDEPDKLRQNFFPYLFTQLLFFCIDKAAHHFVVHIQQ